MYRNSAINIDVTHQRQRVLTEAVVNAAEIMGLNQALLAQTIGISGSSVSRMKTGDYLLK